MIGKKPVVLEAFQHGGRAFAIERHTGWFGKRVLSLVEGEKVHTRMGYKLRGGSGWVEAVGLDYQISVPEALRGRRLYSRMFDHAIRELKEMGAMEIRMEVSPEDAKSGEKIAAMLAKRGFTKESEEQMPLPFSEAALPLMPLSQKLADIWVWKKNV